ncbi:MAG: bifunctional 5,10-methylenetetrahydrofolate dehydrogenase/5,10-methenyltetrahydrofolate cyclohydrolase [Anaeroplasmataceae bacterium]
MVISGKELALKLRNDFKEEVVELKKKHNRTPHLVVILVGEDPGSVSYVLGKEKASNEIGIKNTSIKLDSKVSEKTLLDLIHQLNEDDTVDGILVQLPLPKHINEEKIISSINYNKDVDGFHPLNVASLWKKNYNVVACTPKGIIKLLDSIECDLNGKNVCVIGRSNIVGLPITKLLIDRNATVTVCHSKTNNIKEITSKADVLIVAIGQPKYVDHTFVKDGAIVIDVGVNRDIETNKLCGDVDFDSVKDKVSHITKVPGGVGPMTIACLLENTIESFKKKFEGKK